MATAQTKTTRPPRPVGMAWLIPALPVQNVERTLNFLQKCFGFEKGISMPGQDGKLIHAEVKYEGEIIAMFGLEGAYGGTCKSPATSKTECPITLYVYCDNVDALYAKAKSAGATVVSEPKDMFWGDRTAEFSDPDGYRWMFATNVADFDASKAPKS
jgi:uncharacterized glyoxalase superfamily protein PhnB